MKTQNITRAKLKTSLARNFVQINKQWAKMVEVLIAYKQTTPDTSYNSALGFTSLDDDIDGLALKTAWVKDCLDGKLTPVSRKDTARVRIRKALGYTCP